MFRFSSLFWFPVIVNLGVLFVGQEAEAAECILFADGFEAQATINHRPVITSQPGTPASAGHLYLYPVQAMDRDADPLSYALLSGPTGMTLSAETGQLSWQPSAADLGSHAVQLEVSDGRGGCAIQSYDLFVIADAPNQPPVAQPGSDQTVQEGSLITLDGSASTDADGYITAWRWEQVSGPVAQMANNFSSKAQVVAPPVGGDEVLEFRLTVTDNRNAEAADSVLITVTPNLNDGDADGDMIPDAKDAFPNDSSDAYDYDGDGTGDNADDDRDGDGVANAGDFYPDDSARHAAPLLSIDAPLNNAGIANDSVVVRGTLNAPWNTGVTVNNRIALRGGSPWGNEFALRLPLLSGVNTIEVVVTGQSGRQLTQTLNITRTADAAFHLDAAPLRAFAPAEVLFMADIPAGLNVQQADWDFDGDGNIDTSLLAGFNEPVSHTYANAGLYYPVLTLTDDQNQTYSQTLAISIVDKAEQDSRLKSLWAAMTQALADKNLGLSRSFLLTASSSGYARVYYLLLPYMPSIVPGFSLPENVNMGLDHAEYAVGENINGTYRVFLVQLLRNALGVWKVDGM